jgi:hypothetical protein
VRTCNVGYEDAHRDFYIPNAIQMTSKSQFPYLPLSCPGEIRLITISAGQFNDPLICTISHRNLDLCNTFEYETISYCWSDAAQRKVIALNSHKISVSSSSAAALRCVRLCHSDRTVWLDAICINQNDFEERSRQVAMMGAIYRNGARNLIYLGDEEVGEAINSIAAILKDATETKGSFARGSIPALELRWNIIPNHCFDFMEYHGFGQFI